MRRMKDKIEGTITNADSALAVENLSASVDVASSGKSADITLSSLTKAKAKLNVAVTGVATMGKKGTTSLTIDVPNQNDLLNALTNDDIDAITGGMVDDDGNPIKPNEVIVDASLTVSGRAADAKVTGTRISEALSIAKSADAGLTNVRTELDKLKLDSVAVDKTLTKENFAADAKVVGDALAGKADKSIVQDESGNVIFYSKAAVDELLAGKLGLHDAADNGVVTSGAGYVRFGDGTQICWGRIVFGQMSPNSATFSKFVFAVPFSNTDYAIMSLQTGDVGGTNFLAINLVAKTTTDATVSVYNSKEYGTNAGVIHDCIAIGRWK